MKKLKFLRDYLGHKYTKEERNTMIAGGGIESSKSQNPGERFNKSGQPAKPFAVDSFFYSGCFFVYNLATFKVVSVPIKDIYLADQSRQEIERAHQGKNQYGIVKVLMSRELIGDDAAKGELPNQYRYWIVSVDNDDVIKNNPELFPKKDFYKPKKG